MKFRTNSLIDDEFHRGISAGILPGRQFGDGRLIRSGIASRFPNHHIEELSP